LPLAFVALGIVLVAAAGLAGWVGRAASVPQRAAPEAPPRVIDLGAVSVSVPSTWDAAGARVDGVAHAGADAAAFAPLPGLSARALIVLAPFDDPTLVPEPLRALATGAPHRTALAGLPAWSYRRQTTRDGRVAQVTVAPTTAGSLTVVCIAQEAAWSGAVGCAEDLGPATTRGATPLVPSRSLAFRRGLSPVFERLNARRGELRARLRAAPTRRGQARFSAKLGRAHERSLVALSPRTPATGAARRVVTELRRTARAYRRLSVAAQQGWPARYRLARLAISRSDRALARAVAQVR
jgi:hypothetical protein